MTDDRQRPVDPGEPEQDPRSEAPVDSDTGGTLRREPSFSHHDEPAEPDPDDSQRQGRSDDEPDYIPYVESRRRWSPLRLTLLGLGVLAVLGVIYFVLFAGSEPKGPTLESRLQSQQQVIDQLRVRIEELQSGQDERRSQAEGNSNRLGEIASRLDDLEARRQTSPLQALPEHVQALSDRVDELSSSVDVRFSATQEKEQSLEASIEEVRKLRASQKTAAQQSQPSRQRQTRRAPEPPSPPFSVSGVELRGGRSYLAVASGNAGRLSDLRLVGEGQNIGSWHLSSIDGHSAAFTIDGQTVVVPVP
ncbi:hypothetical protein BTW08_16385 [Salinicola sp. MH3R3-1]|uniref:hypothetical protein n=1 Tax=Salinicola sp. MH3R3-1 TaxID=1928762 RepID=UPI00094ECF87|nr:hypothetical protein [Salinicola sp. MH3R3-1]OLO06724.1 hypothetical protein BTW08_16385 [Salinicola sp. MH3R3-1]